MGTGRPIEKIHKDEWLFRGNEEGYINKVMRYVIQNGLQLSKFVAELEYKGVEIPNKVKKQLYSRLSANPL